MDLQKAYHSDKLITDETLLSNHKQETSPRRTIDIIIEETGKKKKKNRKEKNKGSVKKGMNGFKLLINWLGELKNTK